MILDQNLWIISDCGDTVSVAFDAADAGAGDGDLVQTRNSRTIGPEKLLELLMVVISDVSLLQSRIKQQFCKHLSVSLCDLLHYQDQDNKREDPTRLMYIYLNTYCSLKMCLHFICQWMI